MNDLGFPIQAQDAVPVLPSVAAALAVLDRLENEIVTAPSMAALDAAANAAAGIQRTFKGVKDVADRAGECWISAERKLAEELAKLPPATGTRGQLAGKASGHGPSWHLPALTTKSTGGSNMEPPVDLVPTLKEMGVDKKRAARSKHLAAIPADTIRTYEKQLKDKGKGITPDAILREHRAQNKAEVKHAVSTAVFSHEGPFGTVVIDPPWHMEKIDRDDRPNQDAFDYPTMSYQEIATLWAKEVLPRLEADCHLFLWTTQKHLPAALNLLPEFGFRYVLGMVWHKPGGFQPIGLPQYNCEFAIYARRGSPIFIDTKAFNCCFEAPRREHSRKPDLFYDTIRRVTGGSRIDVFSREQRDGFAQFGNQIDKFVG